MKLCIVCAEYPPGPHGGIGTKYRILARAFVRLGHQVRVIGTYPAGYPAPDYEEDEGVRVWRLRDAPSKFGWLPSRLRLFGTVRGWIASGKVDLVEAPDSRGWFGGWPPLPVPLVLRSSGSNTYLAYNLGRPVNRLTHWMEAYSYRRCDAWTAETQYLADVTRKVFNIGPPDAILPNIADPPAEIPAFQERDARRVVFAGTLNDNKGIEHLIQAWPLVLSEAPDAELVVFGKDSSRAEGGSMRTYLESRLEPGVGEKVHFRGHVEREEVLDAFMKARVGVFPSFSESFGMVAVEAMGCGLPVVFTRSTSGPEVVKDGTSGLLVTPGEPAEIAAAVLRLLREDATAEAFSAAGRARVLEHYTAEQILPKTERFYEDVIRHFRLSPGSRWQYGWFLQRGAA